MAPSVPNPPRREQRQGTRQAMVWGAGAALLVFVAVCAGVGLCNCAQWAAWRHDSSDAIAVNRCAY